MTWNEDEICGTLRSQMDGHPPTVVLGNYKADGEVGGYILRNRWRPRKPTNGYDEFGSLWNR